MGELPSVTAGTSLRSPLVGTVIAILIFSVVSFGAGVYVERKGYLKKVGAEISGPGASVQ